MEETLPNDLFSVPEDVDHAIHEALGMPEGEQSAAFDELVRAFPGHSTQIRARRRLATDEDGVDMSPELTLGRYHLVALLGGGGMGKVHLAFDPQLERHVAIKLMAPFLMDRDAQRRRFVREATAVAAVRHPHLCRVLEAQPTDEQPYIVMDYIEGQSLDKRLRDAALGLGSVLPGMEGESEATLDSPATPSSAPALHRVLQFLEKVARALHELHDRGLVHRDIKPGNLMVTPVGDPVVIDFGLLLAEHAPALTGEGEALGTREYKAPEQFRSHGAKPDARADVFSLGLVLYECLTTQPAFGRDRGPAETPEPAHRLNQAIPTDVRAVLEKATELEPHRRYQSVLAFAEDLKRVREGHPPLAKRIGVVGRLSRWSKRNPWAAGFVVVLMAGLVSSLVLISEVSARVTQDTVRAGFRASALGQWHAGLESFEEASKRGYDDEVELQVGRVEAYDALLQIGEVRRVLEELDRHPDPGAWRPKIELLRADLEMFGARDATSARTRLESLRGQAIGEKFTEADAAYRDALAAERAPDVIAALNRCLVADPSYRRAREALVPLLLLGGQTDTALMHAGTLESVSPRDPLARFLRIGCSVALGQPADVDHGQARLSDDEAAALEELTAILEEFARSYGRFDGSARTRHLITESPGWFAGNPEPTLKAQLGSVTRLVSENARRMNQAYEQRGLAGGLRRLHPVVEQALGAVSRGLGALEERHSFREAADRWPNAFTLFALACSDIYAQDWPAAEQNLQRARQLRFVADLEPIVRWFELKCAGEASLREAPDFSRVGPLVREHALWLLDWARLGPDELQFKLHLAKKVGEHALALDVARSWTQRFPDDPQAWLWYSNQHLEQKSPIAAYVLGEKALSFSEPHPSAEQNMISVRKKLTALGLDPDSEVFGEYREQVRERLGLAK